MPWLLSTYATFSRETLLVKLVPYSIRLLTLICQKILRGWTKMLFVPWGKTMEQPINRSKNSTFSRHLQNFYNLICILPPSVPLRYFTIFYHLLLCLLFLYYVVFRHVILYFSSCSVLSFILNREPLENQRFLKKLIAFV